MTYKDFTIEQLLETFGLKDKKDKLFVGVESMQPSDHLLKSLERASNIALRNEKVRSELFLAPILLEMVERNKGQITLFSGEKINIEPENGLKGECDFLITQDMGGYSMSGAILAIVEAKKQDIDLGMAQCAAQMVGVQKYNKKRGFDFPYLYGCVSTVDEWLFMKLENNILYIEDSLLFRHDLNKILGIFQFIIDQYKTILVPIA